MVTCNFAGRLGNNLFQMAATIGVAVNNNASFAFDNKYIGILDSKYIFTDRYNEFTDYYEPTHEYNEIPYSPNLRLNGYFQSEKYFAHASRFIREVILNDNIFAQTNAVAIHIRRGDYLQYPTKHPVPDIENYYFKAMSLFKNRKFIVFSDDEAYCREVFKDNKNVIFCTDNMGWSLSDYGWLNYMASCTDFIIANSSYSWWGAWLSSNPKKRIISPTKEQWFGVDNKHLSTKDLIPDYFEQLEY